MWAATSWKQPDDRRERLALEEAELVRPGLVVRVVAAGHRAVLDEVGPAALGECDVLDQPAERQLADRGREARLLVGEAVDGVEEEVALLGERLEHGDALGVELGLGRGGHRGSSRGVGSTVRSDATERPTTAARTEAARAPGSRGRARHR